MKKTLALLLAVLMLCATAVATVSAAETADWKQITGNLGLHVYVGAPMEVSPVLDGVVNEGEYSYTKEWTPEEIVGYGTEIQSGITEYIAHDANFVYYAATFKQGNDDRAFQLQFKCDNTFAIFNSKGEETVDDLKATLFQRVCWQLRYQADGSTTVAQLPAWNYSMNVRPPRAVGDTVDLEFAAAKTADLIKTYEVKISKAYIAEYAGCTVEEVSVVPYFLYIHSGPFLGAVYTEDMTQVLKDAGATRADTGNLFLFMVLEEDPSKIPPVTEAPTTEAATEAATTEAPTTEAATTEAPATTEATADKGCGSALTVSAIALLPTLAGGALLAKRRKED